MTSGGDGVAEPAQITTTLATTVISTITTGPTTQVAISVRLINHICLAVNAYCR